MTEHKQYAWQIRAELYDRALYLVHNDLFDEFFHEEELDFIVQGIGEKVDDLTEGDFLEGYAQVIQAERDTW